jgi:murein L,D-transpeptidase YcbB/YkuD
VQLAATSLLIIAISVFGATVLAGNDAAGSDRTYLAALSNSAGDSASIGRSLTRFVERPQVTRSEIEASLTDLLRRQQRDTAALVALAAAPTLRDEQTQAADAMTLRRSGIASLIAALQRTAPSPASVSASIDRLLTSDVIWRDLFQPAVRRQLARDDAHGVGVPTSTFLLDPRIAEASEVATLLARLQRGVVALPAPIIKFGDTGAQITAWQRQLNDWLVRNGHTKLPVNGTFDQATLEATKQLQSAEGITTDGIVGPLTRAALTRTLG